MFGLEFISKLYNTDHSEISKNLGINRANISMWIKNKHIPIERIEKISKLFIGVPASYFNKELNEEEEREVVASYIKQLAENYRLDISIKY